MIAPCYRCFGRFFWRDCHGYYDPPDAVHCCYCVRPPFDDERFAEVVLGDDGVYRYEIREHVPLRAPLYWPDTNEVCASEVWPADASEKWPFLRKFLSRQGKPNAD